MANKFESPTSLDKQTKDSFEKSKIITPSKDQSDVIKKNLESEEDIIELTEDMIVKKEDKKESAEKKSEPKEINLLITSGFKEDLNINKDDLEKFEGFKELSYGQQLLVLENLKQIKLGRIHEESLTKLEKQKIDANFLGKIWKGVSKKYQILKLEKSTAERIREGGIELHRKTLEQFIKGIKEFETEVTVVGGRPEIQYASSFKDLNPEENKKVKNFNAIATRFSMISDEWSKETASKENQKKYKQVKKEYEEAKGAILNLKAEKDGEESSALYMNKIDSNVRLNQFFNTHPEVEAQLKMIENEKVWKKALLNVVTERGIYAGAGFLTRTAVTSLIGTIGLPLAAAGMGSFIARKRSKETLREAEIMTRKGDLQKSLKVDDLDRKIKETIHILQDKGLKKRERKEYQRGLKDHQKQRDMLTVKKYSEIQKVSNKIEKITKKLQEGGLSEKQIKANKKSLKVGIDWINDKLDKGLINFGKAEDRILKQYNLINALSNGYVAIQGYELDEKWKKNFDYAIKGRDTKSEKIKRKYIRSQMVRGALMGAGFAAAGAGIRAMGEDLGWWGGNEILPKKHVPVDSDVPVEDNKNLIKKPDLIEKPIKPDNVVDLMIVKKGESTLLLAKKLYVKNAASLGYKESMGDLNKWAERLSTRHLIGQYISEHPEEYKELIDKAGPVPKDLVQLDKWMRKVPGSTFNDILNNKVASLIHVGDKVGIGANGDINAYNPDGKLRIGNLPIETQKVITAEGFGKIMEVEEFSNLSPEQVEKIDKLFSRHLGASFEGFQSFDASEKAEKIANLEKVINKLKKEPSSNFIKRQIQELNMVKDIWKKFGTEEIELPKTPEIPQEPIHSNEVDIGELRGETPVGSEDNIREMERFLKKEKIEISLLFEEKLDEETINKLIEHMKSGKIDRRDFKELLFDQARVEDNYISNKEKERINLIIKIIDSKK